MLILLTALGLPLLAAALFFGIMTWVFSDMCGNDNVVEALSPNGQLKAVTFRRNCGATTGYSEHVSILPASAKLPNDFGNVLSASDDPTLVVRWQDDGHLSIEGAPFDAPHREKEFKGVQITYP